jgi:hypothetical protein
MTAAKRNVLRHVLAWLQRNDDNADKLPASIMIDLVALGYFDEETAAITDKGRELINAA